MTRIDCGDATEALEVYLALLDVEIKQARVSGLFKELGGEG